LTAHKIIPGLDPGIPGRFEAPHDGRAKSGHDEFETINPERLA
jgi:hypothetical protein